MDFALLIVGIAGIMAVIAALLATGRAAAQGRPWAQWGGPLGSVAGAALTYLVIRLLPYSHDIAQSAIERGALVSAVFVAIASAAYLGVGRLLPRHRTAAIVTTLLATPVLVVAGGLVTAFVVLSIQCSGSTDCFG